MSFRLLLFLQEESIKLLKMDSSVILFYFRFHNNLYTQFKPLNLDYYKVKIFYIILSEINSLKGKYAQSTQYRRLIWEDIVWPLILELNRSYFSLEEYQNKRKDYSHNHDISLSKLSGGLISLVLKGILKKEKELYSLHYRLIPYMRKKTNLTYGQVLREICSK